MRQIESVYFFCCPSGPPENTAYLHNIVALVEGLQQLGVATHSNRDYWQNESGFLLRHSNVDFRNCDVVFFDAAYYDTGFSDLLPKDLFKRSRKYRLVYNDCSDGLITAAFKPEIREVDIVLKSHYNINYKYPDNFVPWQFGLTNRIMQQVQPLPFKQREKQFLNNFRVPHPIRTMAQEKIAPILRLFLKENADTDSIEDAGQMSIIDTIYWCQTGRRHYPNYYKRLSESYACFCFGGGFQKNFYSRKGWIWKLIYKADWHLSLFPYDRIFQYDSWRFWESMVAGCCTLHVSFEKYGIQLPVMPINGLHYLGVDFNDVRSFQSKVEKDNAVFETIGNAGRQWVLEHYNPKSTAERFLNLVKN